MIRVGIDADNFLAVFLEQFGQAARQGDGQARIIESECNFSCPLFLLTLLMRLIYSWLSTPLREVDNAELNGDLLEEVLADGLAELILVYEMS
jgi:hypothetical protein